MHKYAYIICFIKPTRLKKEGKMKKKILIVLLCLLMVGSLASLSACSKKGTTIKEIQKAGKLVLLTSSGFPPFEYVEGTDVVGVDVELAQLVADKLGVELEVIDMDFNLLIEALKSGKGDLIAAGMTATDERAEEIDFSIVYIEMGLKVIVPIDSALTSFDQLDGKKIAVQASTTADIYAQNNYKNAQLLQFTKPIDAVNAVMSGNADAAIIDLLPAQAFVNENPTKIKLMDGLLSEEKTAMGVQKNSDEFLALVNEVLQEALDDGTFDAIYQEHMNKYVVE